MPLQINPDQVCLYCGSAGLRIENAKVHRSITKVLDIKLMSRESETTKEISAPPEIKCNSCGKKYLLFPIGNIFQRLDYSHCALSSIKKYGLSIEILQTHAKYVTKITGLLDSLAEKTKYSKSTLHLWVEYNELYLLKIEALKSSDFTRFICFEVIKVGDTNA